MYSFSAGKYFYSRLKAYSNSQVILRTTALKKYTLLVFLKLVYQVQLIFL